MVINNIYEPAEDSYLLQKCVRQEAAGRVLDVGTGSGIQAITAAENPMTREIVAVDINPDVVAALQEQIRERRLRKIKVLQSDLFENVDGQFSVIIFNPPYLPQDEGIEDPALYGGKNGWEISERFFHDASRFLLPQGKILFLFSSLTNKEKIEQIITHHLLSFTEIASEKVAFETLYVYAIQKSPLLREIEGKGVEQIHHYAQGKRGIIYRGKTDMNQYVKKFIPTKKNYMDVAIKVKKEESTAERTIEKEAEWLERLNKLRIGPRLIFATPNSVITEFIVGENLPEWLEHHSRDECRRVLQQVLGQCFTLDQQKITKEEMHHPYKHIIVDRFNNPIFIDFERCHETEKPQNVTQFVEYICRLKPVLEKNGLVIDVDKLRTAAKEYKEKYTKEMFNNIIKWI